MPTGLPENKIKKVRLPDNTEYEIVPATLQDGTTNYKAELPQLAADSTIALRSDLSNLNADKVDGQHLLDQSYSYVGSLTIKVGCVNAVVHTGLTESEILALTGNRYGQLYLASDTNKYWRRKNTQTTASSANWRNDTTVCTNSLALPNQLTTEDYVYIKLNTTQSYYSKLPKFFVEAPYDNTNGSTQITGFCRQQNQFEITSCSYNGNNLLGIYQPSANTNIYYFKFKKFASSYGADTNYNVTPVIYFNFGSDCTLEYIGKNHTDYATVKAYSYIDVPTYGIKGTAIYDSLLPFTNNSKTLGSSSARWNTAYINNLHDGTNSLATSGLINTVKIDNTTVSSGHTATIPTMNGNYSSTNKLATKSDLPTVNNNTITIKQTGISDQTFTLNQSSDKTITLVNTDTTYELVNTGTSSDGIKFLEDVTYTSASSSGSNTVSKSTHTHTVTANGSVSLGSNTTSTGGVAYVESISSTGASASGTAKAGSETHTHTYDKTTGVTLTANDSTATGRVTYLQDVTYTAPSLSGTKTFNTDAIKSVSLTASTTSTDGPAYVESISGGGAVSATTKYMKFNAGTTPKSGATPNHTSTNTGANSGTKVTAVTGIPNFSGGSGSFEPTTKYLSASFSGSAVTSGANSGTNVNAVTGYPNFSGGSLGGTKTFVTGITAGSGSLTSNDTSTDGIPYIASASYTAASLGSPSTATVSINGGSGSLSGARTTTGEGAAYRRRLTLTHIHTSASLSGTTTFVTGYPNFSGGSATHTSKYLHHTHVSASSSGTGTVSLTPASLGTPNTSSVAPGSHTHSVTADGSVTLTANVSTATGRITYLESASHTHTGASLGTLSTADVSPNAHTHTYDKTTSVSLTDGTAPSINFNTGTSTDTPYISAVSGGSAVSATIKYMKATGTSAGTGTVGISGGSVSKTTKYLSASPSTTSTNSGQPSATTTFVTGVTGGTTTPTTKYFHPSFTGSSATTSDGSNATATAVSGITSGSVTKTTKYMKLEEEN